MSGLTVGGSVTVSYCRCSGFKFGGSSSYQFYGRSAELRGSDFKGAKIGSAEFYDSDLSGSDLRDADFSLAQGFIFELDPRVEAKLSGAKYNDGTKFPSRFDRATANRRGMIYSP